MTLDDDSTLAEQVEVLVRAVTAAMESLGERVSLLEERTLAVLGKQHKALLLLHKRSKVQREVSEIMSGSIEMLTELAKQLKEIRHGSN